MSKLPRNEAEIRAQLETVMSSPRFIAAPRLSDFLRYVVNLTLIGREEEIKEFLIATEVYGRPASYDPQVDSTVRVEASRLRGRLREYYSNEGQDDPICFELPKGSYVPRFTVHSPKLGVIMAPEAPARQSLRNRYLAAIVTAVTFIALAFGWTRWNAAPESPVGITSLAVLPFVNLSADPDSERFTDGITEEITTNVAHIEGLRVPSRTTMYLYKNKPVDIIRVGREVKVRALLEGSVRREKDRFLITAQLIDASDGYHIWAETYDQASQDPLGLQRTIAARIASALRERTSGRQSWRNAGKVEDRKALSLYFRAHELLRESVYQEGWPASAPPTVLEAISLFEQATREEPDFAKAWVGLAEAQEFAYELDRARPAHRLSAAKDALAKAIRIDPTLPEAYAIQSSIYFYRDRNLPLAEAAVRRAMELNPRDVTTHQRYADLLRIQGRFSEARNEISRALTLQPTASVLWAKQAQLLYDEDRYQEALDAAGRSLSLNPTKQMNQFAMATWIRGLCFERLGKYKEAEAEFVAARVREPHDPWNEPALGHLLALTGRARESEEVLAELHRQMKRGKPLQYAVALVHSAAGRRKEALDWLEEGLRKGDPSMMFLHLEKRFEHLGGEVRFQQLLKEVRRNALR